MSLLERFARIGKGSLNFLRQVLKYRTKVLSVAICVFFLISGLIAPVSALDFDPEVPDFPFPPSQGNILYRSFYLDSAMTQGYSLYSDIPSDYTGGLYVLLSFDLPPSSLSYIDNVIFVPRSYIFQAAGVSLFQVDSSSNTLVRKGAGNFVSSGFRILGGVLRNLSLDSNSSSTSSYFTVYLNFITRSSFESHFSSIINSPFVPFLSDSVVNGSVSQLDYVFYRQHNNYVSWSDPSQYEFSGNSIDYSRAQSDDPSGYFINNFVLFTDEYLNTIDFNLYNVQIDYIFSSDVMTAGHNIFSGRCTYSQSLESIRPNVINTGQLNDFNLVDFTQSNSYYNNVATFSCSYLINSQEFLNSLVSGDFYVDGAHYDKYLNLQTWYDENIIEVWYLLQSHIVSFSSLSLTVGDKAKPIDEQTLYQLNQISGQINNVINNQDTYAAQAHSDAQAIQGAVDSAAVQAHQDAVQAHQDQLALQSQIAGEPQDTEKLAELESAMSDYTEAHDDIISIWEDIQEGGIEINGQLYMPTFDGDTFNNISEMLGFDVLGNDRGAMTFVRDTLNGFLGLKSVAFFVGFPLLVGLIAALLGRQYV